MSTNIDKNIAEKAFLNKLTIYSLALTIFVVLSHWGQYYVTTASTGAFVDLLSRLWSVLGTTAISFFFLASGFMIMRGVQSMKDVRERLLRRVVCLGVPFLLWNTLMLLYRIAYGLYKGNLSLDLADVLMGYTLTPFNSPTWYLLALLLLSALTPLFLLLKDRGILGALAVALVFVGGYLSTMLWAPSATALVWIWRLISYLPAYVIGAAVSVNSASAVVEEKVRYSRFVRVGAAVLSALLVILCALGTEARITLLYPIYIILPVLLWLAVPAAPCERVRLALPLCVAPIVYVLHTPLILILNSLWTRKLFGGVDFPLVVDLIFHLLLLAILYAVCLGVALLLRWLLPEKIYKIIAGGKSGTKMF